MASYKNVNIYRILFESVLIVKKMQKVWSVLRSCITNYCRSKLPSKLVNSISFRSIRDVGKRNLKRIILGHLNINSIRNKFGTSNFFIMPLKQIMSTSTTATVHLFICIYLDHEKTFWSCFDHGMLAQDK